MFGGEAGRVSECNSEMRSFTKPWDKDVMMLGEAGGADGSVGDGVLDSTWV